MDKNFYYTILGVSPDATEDEIDKRYRDLIKKYHPDSGVNNDEMFKLLTKAREVLTDDKKRKEYDKAQKEDQEYTVPSGGYRDDSDPKGNYYDSGQESGDVIEKFLLGLDRAQIAILQVLLTVFLLKLLTNTEKLNMSEIGSNLFAALAIGTVVAFIVKSQQKFNILKIIQTALSLILPLIILVFGLAAVFSLLKLNPGTEAMLSTIACIIIPLLINLFNFFAIFNIVRQSNYLGQVRKLTAYMGFVCSILLLAACAITVPTLYGFVYASSANVANKQANVKEREEYLADFEKRNVPMSLPAEGDYSDGGKVSITTIMKGASTYTAMKDNAKVKVEGTRHLYPFEYLTGEEAMSYLMFVTGKQYSSDNSEYDYCIIRFVQLDNIENIKEYESYSCDNTKVSIKIQPQNEAYKSGYYVNGKVLKAEAEVTSFSPADGYIMLKTPKGYYEYNITIKHANSEEFIIDVSEYFE